MSEDLSVITGQLLAELDRLPGWCPRAIARDDMDPDETSVYYRSEGRQRVLASLGNVRLMAQVAATVGRLAPLIAILAEEESEVTVLPVIHMSMTSLTAFRRRVERDLLAEMKQKLSARVTWLPAIEAIDEMLQNASAEEDPK